MILPVVPPGDVSAHRYRRYFSERRGPTETRATSSRNGFPTLPVMRWVHPACEVAPANNQGSADGKTVVMRDVWADAVDDDQATPHRQLVVGHSWRESGVSVCAVVDARPRYVIRSGLAAPNRCETSSELPGAILWLREGKSPGWWGFGPAAGRRTSALGVRRLGFSGGLAWDHLNTYWWVGYRNGRDHLPHLWAVAA